MQSFDNIRGRAEPARVSFYRAQGSSLAQTRSRGVFFAIFGIFDPMLFALPDLRVAANDSIAQSPAANKTLRDLHARHVPGRVALLPRSTTTSKNSSGEHEAIQPTNERACSGISIIFSKQKNAARNLSAVSET
jgi:hypothetical protein